jgi:hypothetical protein
MTGNHNEFHDSQVLLGRPDIQTSDHAVEFYPDGAKLISAGRVPLI